MGEGAALHTFKRYAEPSWLRLGRLIVGRPEGAALWAAPAALRKEDRAVVARAVQNVNHVDSLGGLADDAIENLVAAMNAVPHAATLVSRHEWEGERHVPKTQALVSQFPHEAHGAARIVSGDVIADGLKLCLSGGQNANVHGLPFTIARYFASSRSNTSSAGLPRSASESAMPRPITASSATRCVS